MKGFGQRGGGGECAQLEQLRRRAVARAHKGRRVAGGGVDTLEFAAQLVRAEVVQPREKRRRLRRRTAARVLGAHRVGDGGREALKGTRRVVRGGPRQRRRRAAGKARLAVGDGGADDLGGGGGGDAEAAEAGAVRPPGRRRPSFASDSAGTQPRLPRRPALRRRRREECLRHLTQPGGRPSVAGRLCSARSAAAAASASRAEECSQDGGAAAEGGARARRRTKSTRSVRGELRVSVSESAPRWAPPPARRLRRPDEAGPQRGRHPS